MVLGEMSLDTGNLEVLGSLGKRSRVWPGMIELVCKFDTWLVEWKML